MCDVTEDLWVCIPDNLHQSNTKLPIHRRLHVGTTSQDRQQNVINSFSQVA